MTEIEKIQDQLNRAYTELINIDLVENELLYDYIFEAQRLVKKINYTQCCTEFKCGEERVFNEEKCSEQCSQCKEDYSEDI